MFNFGITRVVQRTPRTLWEITYYVRSGRMAWPESSLYDARLGRWQGYGFTGA